MKRCAKNSEGVKEVLAEELKVHIETSELDEALVKAERLVNLLKEAEQIVNSLAERK